MAVYRPAAFTQQPRFLPAVLVPAAAPDPGLPVPAGPAGLARAAYFRAPPQPKTYRLTAPLIPDPTPILIPGPAGLTRTALYRPPPPSPQQRPAPRPPAAVLAAVPVIPLPYIPGPAGLVRSAHLRPVHRWAHRLASRTTFIPASVAFRVDLAPRAFSFAQRAIAFTFAQRSMAMTGTAETNERSGGYLTVAFTDKAGAPAIPTGVTYSVWCATNQQQVRPATSVYAAASIEIQLDAGDTAILNPKRAYETRLVTVSATFSSGDECHDQFEVRVRNLGRLAPA